MDISWTSQRVQSLVSAFGGINPLSRALNYKHRTTVKQWVERGKIPVWRYREIAEAAQSTGTKLPAWFKP